MTSATQITSRSNPWFRRIRQAAASHESEIVLEGPKQIRDAIDLGWKPIAVALSPDAAAIPASSPILRFSQPLFNALSSTVQSQGAIGLFERPEVSPREILAAGGLVIVLDGVQDPGNVGVIVRLAAAFEASGVVLTEGTADPFGPKAIRASAAAILSVPIARADRADILRLSEELNIPLFAADASGEPSPPPVGRSALIFGSEGAGVSADFRKVSTLIGIAMSPRTESLNVASAAAILLEASYRLRNGVG
jgi:RNA methyltransferase, TrmH family